MTTHNAASASITNNDASPRVTNTNGEGGAGYLQEQSDYVTVAAAAAALSQLRFVRVDTKIHLKSLIFESEAQGAGKVQLGLYYADNDNDIAPGNSANKGAVVSGCVALFSDDIDCASAVLPTDKNLMSVDKKNMPLWQAAGLATDPGGKFDIVGTVHTTDVTTGTGKMGVRANFVTP
jgi:hypothetical protein